MFFEILKSGRFEVDAVFFSYKYEISSVIIACFCKYLFFIFVVELPGTGPLMMLYPRKRDVRSILLTPGDYKLYSEINFVEVINFKFSPPTKIINMQMPFFSLFSFRSFNCFTKFSYVIYCTLHGIIS